MIVCVKECNFCHWKEECIDLFYQKNLLDVGALLAKDETRKDSMSKFEDAGKKCKIEKPIKQFNNVGNEKFFYN